MYFKLKSICNILNQYNSIIIYGTGNYAGKIYSRLVEQGLKQKILCFTQTEESNVGSIDGISVISLDKLNCDKTECIVLIAVSRVYEADMRKELAERQFCNFITLTDYIWDDRQSEKLLNQKSSFKEYCKCIAKWYIETQNSTEMKETIVKELLDRGVNTDKKRDLNLVVMICGHLSPRTIKIISALRTKRYDIVVLDYCLHVNQWCLDELQKLNLNTYKCQCVEEMLYWSLQYRPLVYFFEPRWGDCSWAVIMLKNKIYFGKVVLALYDVLNGGYIGLKESDLATEKYALENSDGIVWRGFSKELLEEKGFKYQGKSLQFIDYCNHKEKSDTAYETTSSVVKFCEVVGYGSDFVYKREYEKRYKDYARIDEILEKIGNRKDCIFHFYMGSLNNVNIKIFEQYEKQYKNFRFFVGTEYGELLERLKEYDYMCFLYTDGEEPVDEVPMGDFFGSVYRNTIRNAFFDGFYAGIPVVTTYASKLWEYLSDYDIVIKMDLPDLDLNYLKQNRQYYKDKVREAAKDLDINNHIGKLTDFFNDL